jgi:hypothetical protein
LVIAEVSEKTHSFLKTGQIRAIYFHMKNDGANICFPKSTLYFAIMKQFLPLLLIAASLTACGGGGSDSSATNAAPAAAAPAPAAAAAVAPAAAPAPTPTVSAPTLVEAPVASGAVNMTAGRFSNTGSAGNYSVTFSGATDLTINGDLNRMWLGAVQNGGSVTINGASNTIVFKPTSTPTTVAVTGSANTFYLPENSAITLTGTGAAMSTVKYYKP